MNQPPFLSTGVLVSRLGPGLRKVKKISLLGTSLTCDSKLYIYGAMSVESITSQSMVNLAHIDLSKPRYDQSSYKGRVKHFFETANPLTIFASNRKLAQAAQLVKTHK